ncbi:hypothetical protein RHS03_07896, partial [Rhizoctonia solani]
MLIELKEIDARIGRGAVSNNGAQASCIVMGVENEVGAAGSDPSIRAVHGKSYAQSRTGLVVSTIMVVYIDGVDLGRNIDTGLPVCVSKGIQEALGLFYKQDLVFEAAKNPKIIFVNNENAAVTGVRFIGFNWCKNHMERRDPFDMDSTLH